MWGRQKKASTVKPDDAIFLSDYCTPGSAAPVISPHASGFVTSSVTPTFCSTCSSSVFLPQFLGAGGITLTKEGKPKVRKPKDPVAEAIDRAVKEILD